MEFVQPIRDKKKIDSMKKILKATNLRDWCLFTLGINSGLRISDLLSFKIGDVLDENLNVKTAVEIREQKTGKYRRVPLTKHCIQAIEEYLEKDRKEYTRGEYLFQSRQGGDTPISRIQAWRIINNAAREVGIEDKIGTHTLRKTFGYQAHKNGADITQIQKILNHASPSVTMAYIGITQDELDDIILNLNL